MFDENSDDTLSGEVFNPDFKLPNASNMGVKTIRMNEKVQMQSLNHRFANYIENVCVLEQQNKMLSTELELVRGNRSSRVADLYEEEMSDLRRQVDQLTMEKTDMEVTRDNRDKDIERLRDKLQDEILQRQEAENNTRSFKQEVKNAKRKVKSLKEEIVFLRKIYEEEVAELQEQIQYQPVHVEMDSAKPDLTAALRDVRSQYENLATKNFEESEKWYKLKFADLTEAANRNNEALRLAKQEANEFRRQVQVLTCEVDALKGAKVSLERQMKEREDNFEKESSRSQDNIAHLEKSIHNMKDEMARNLRKNQDLLNINMALDSEIATYKDLLDGGESRIATPLSNLSSLNQTELQRLFQT